MSTATAATFNYKVVRQFSIMTVVWGIVGMLVGVIIAAELLWPDLAVRHPMALVRAPAPAAHQRGHFRLRRLGAVRHVVLRRAAHVQVRLFSDALAAFTFWGWNAVIVLAAITLPLGFTSGKEYAELEWPIDILITLVWVAYAVVFFGTILKRKTPHIYVANWFFGAFILTVALLHIVNSAEVPVSFWPMKSYSAYAACRTRWCNGGTVITPSVFSSPPASSGSCTTSSRSRRGVRSTRIACRSCTSGR